MAGQPSSPTARRKPEAAPAAGPGLGPTPRGGEKVELADRVMIGSMVFIVLWLVALGTIL